MFCGIVEDVEEIFKSSQTYLIYSRIVLKWWVQKFNMRKTFNDSDKDDTKNRYKMQIKVRKEGRTQK